MAIASREYEPRVTNKLSSFCDCVPISCWTSGAPIVLVMCLHCTLISGGSTPSGSRCASTSTPPSWEYAVTRASYPIARSRSAVNSSNSWCDSADSRRSRTKSRVCRSMRPARGSSAAASSTSVSGSPTDGPLMGCAGSRMPICARNSSACLRTRNTVSSDPISYRAAWENSVREIPSFSHRTGRRCRWVGASA
ncbi:Uncharacterised protein [Mycobacteroides abscessus subsp. abscessus]|nr:Uncharacterised protein [Mycobacteroides abscessus subsp. abscessus]